MEGLEAVELSLNEVFKDNLSFRIDSEYYGKEFIKTFELMNEIDSDRLDDITTRISVGFVGAMVDEYREEGIQLLQTKNIGQILIDSSAQTFINYSFHSSLKKSQINKGDILIARSGSFGKASIYLGNETINSSDIIIIKVDEKTGYNPFYVTAFLNTLHGKAQMFRFASGGLQGHVNLTILENLKVPNLSTNFQIHIEKLIVSAHQKCEQSKTLYKEAEQTLLTALGLTDYTPTEENISVKSLGESFGKSGRLDSEFYQPKYDEIENVIRNYSGGADILSNQMKSISSGEYSDSYAEFDSVINKIFYIRNSNMSNGEVVVEGDYYINPASFNNFVTKGDIVTSRVGTVGLFASINEDISGSAYSDNVLCISPNACLSSDAYTLYFNSMPNQILLERISKGSVQPLVTQTDIKNLLIPLLEEALQKDLEKLVKKSYQLKQESKHLLGLAKRSVELAIEKDEETAITLIRQGIK